MKWLRSLFLMVSLPFYFSLCKLNLNNAGDTFTKGFLVTEAIKESLRVCKTEQLWERKIGTGNNFVVLNQNLVLPDGNVLIAGIATEPTDPNGSGIGKNQNFVGTIGTTKNGFIAKIDARDGNILWFDYLGENMGDSDEVVGLGLFSNGDIAVSNPASGVEVPNPISPKSSNPSLRISRYDTSGNRLWHTYLDSPHYVGSRSLIFIDDRNQIHTFISTFTSTPPHLGFQEFPAPKVNSSGGNSDNDICYGLLAENGTPIAQTFLSGIGSEDAFTVVQNADRIYIGGRVTNPMNGFSNHPSSGNQRPFVGIADLSANILSVRYYGGSGAGTSGTIQGLRAKNGELYSFGVVDETYGVPVNPFQGSITKRNYLFQKLSVDGSEIWHNFIGSTVTGADVDKIQPGFLLSYTNSIYANLLGPKDKSRFTGIPSDKIFGDGNAERGLQSAFTKMNNVTGELQSIDYRNIFPWPILSMHYGMKEMCVGKVVHFQFVQLDEGKTFGFVRTRTTFDFH